MAHYKRKRRRDRSYSSDWVYPQIEKGKDKRGRYSVAKWAARMNDRLREFRRGQDEKWM